MQKDPDHEPTIGEHNPEAAPEPTGSPAADPDIDEVRDPSGEINDSGDGRSNEEGGLGKNTAGRRSRIVLARIDP